MVPGVVPGVVGYDVVLGYGGFTVSLDTWYILYISLCYVFEWTYYMLVLPTVYLYIPGSI